MTKNIWVFVFVAVLFLLMVASIIKPMVSPTARATAFIEKLCTQPEDCEPNMVCCYFSGQLSGVCDYEGSCTEIGDTTGRVPPKLENPSFGEPTLYYGLLIGLFVAVAVIMFIFFKRNR